MATSYIMQAVWTLLTGGRRFKRWTITVQQCVLRTINQRRQHIHSENDRDNKLCIHDVQAAHSNTKHETAHKYGALFNTMPDWGLIPFSLISTVYAMEMFCIDENEN